MKNTGPKPQSPAERTAEVIEASHRRPNTNSPTYWDGIEGLSERQRSLPSTEPSTVDLSARNNASPKDFRNIDELLDDPARPNEYSSASSSNEISSNQNMGERDNIRDALGQDFNHLGAKYGIEFSEAEIETFVRRASAGDSAPREGMVVAAQEEDPLFKHFRSKDIPQTMWSELTPLVEAVVTSRVRAVTRPKWDERGKYAELKDLSAPLFLKRIYADEIAPDGTIKKETVRAVDKVLMARVENYISVREERQQDMGDAEGLRLIAGPRSRPKRIAPS